eukprot:TRINITY_DN9731_c0_g1_i1.p1 TRINITY_DN9731_c0_g1~~TRINITY_DN9731_c0_g1_i1.p1  ORF type:complete len:332 (+),score=63.75 TRINITY_DN9731_c0_g1_i1:42-998(+)
MQRGNEENDIYQQFLNLRSRPPPTMPDVSNFEYSTKEEYVVMSKCEFAIKDVLKMLPTVGIKGGLEKRLDNWLSLPDDDRVETTRNILDFFRREIMRTEVPSLPESMWPDVVEFLSTMARTNPKRLRDIVFCAFEFGESPPGHPSRITQSLRSFDGSVIEFLVPPAQMTVIRYYRDVRKLPALQTGYDEKYDDYFVVLLGCFAEYLAREDRVLKDMARKRKEQMLSTSNTNKSNSKTKSKPIATTKSSQTQKHNHSQAQTKPQQQQKQAKEKICVCGAAGKKVCGGCKQQRYCSIECQKQDWTNHKLHCHESNGKSKQ